MLWWLLCLKQFRQFSDGAAKVVRAETKAGSQLGEAGRLRLIPDEDTGIASAEAPAAWGGGLIRVLGTLFWSEEVSRLLRLLLHVEVMVNSFFLVFSGHSFYQAVIHLQENMNGLWFPIGAYWNDVAHHKPSCCLDVTLQSEEHTSLWLYGGDGFSFLSVKSVFSM